MEAKHELFWKQVDFGYVKDIVDSTMKLCKPKNKVGPKVTLCCHCMIPSLCHRENLCYNAPRI